MVFFTLHTQWHVAKPCNFLKTNTPRPLRISTRCLKTELSTHTTCYLPQSKNADTTPSGAVPYHPLFVRASRRQIADDLRAPPCPTQPGRGPAHLSNHPPAHLSNHHHLRPAPMYPLWRAPLPPRPFLTPPPLPVSMHACVLPYRRARALGAVFARQSGPRARALTKGRASFALQIFSSVLWAGADRVTPPCAWPPPAEAGGFFAFLLT